MIGKESIILGIESSCDDTAAAVCIDGKIVSNVVSTQDLHAAYGGVVPELASRAHLSNIIPVVTMALSEAGVKRGDLDAIAVTQGPGLLGSLIVGLCAAKGMAASLDIPLISVDHMQAHVMSCFIEEPVPTLPFLCLTISGGHTQLTVVNDLFDMQVIGKTLDDAAGEAFDKIGKLMGLPYPAGPHIDQLAEKGAVRYSFSHADVPDFNFSFSGLKTQVMYFLRDQSKRSPDFISVNATHIAASVRQVIVDMLMNKLEAAARQTGIDQIGIAGGVSANRLVRKQVADLANKNNWQVFIPSMPYCTDNAAMIAKAGYYKFQNSDFTSLTTSPFARAN